MDDERKNQISRSVYETLCAVLEREELRFDRYDDEMRTSLRFSGGENLPLRVVISVRPRTMVIKYKVFLEFSVPENKRVEMATAVCVASYGLQIGAFEFDISDGELGYRLAMPFGEKPVDEDQIIRMLWMATGTTNGYSDKMFMLSKGLMTLSDFIEKENQN